MQSRATLSDLTGMDSFTIDQLIVASHANDLGGTLWNPVVRWHVKYAVFIVIVDDEQHSGVGECWCFDNAPDAVIAFLRTEVCPLLVNKTLPQALDALASLQRRATLTARHGMLATAVSGIDMALWDIAAQRQGVPLWQALNPNGTGRARLYRSGGLYGQNKNNQALVKEMRAMAAAGYDIVKMKVGGLARPLDRERVEQVLNKLSHDVKLIIDGVYAFSAADAYDFYQSLETNRIAAFQSPVAADDIAGMRYLTELAVPVMAIEAEYRREIHTAIIAQRAVRYLQVSAIACGGPSRVLELAREVESTGIALSLEVSSTAFATLAGAHLAAACPEIAHSESHAVHTVFNDLVDLEKNFHDSHWQLPDAPGLGLALPLDNDRVNVEFRLPEFHGH